jgi:hypothetical protein
MRLLCSLEPENGPLNPWAMEVRILQIMWRTTMTTPMTWPCISTTQTKLEDPGQDADIADFFGDEGVFEDVEFDSDGDIVM